jgi:hypothetical protein
MARIIEHPAASASVIRFHALPARGRLLHSSGSPAVSLRSGWRVGPSDAFRGGVPPAIGLSPVAGAAV